LDLIVGIPIYRENPNLKSIVIVRDPIARAESHHRFSYNQYRDHGLADMNVVVDISLAPGSRLDEIYQLALPALKVMRENQAFHHDPAFQSFLETTRKFFMPGARANYTFQRAANTIFFSLYFHPIYSWDQVMGVENVYILEAERIASSRSRKRLDEPLQPVTLAYTGRSMIKSLEEEIGDIYR
jgi:hypothetical protein